MGIAEVLKMKKSVKTKLMAAISMLLVSAILLSTSTYNGTNTVTIKNIYSYPISVKFSTDGSATCNVSSPKELAVNGSFTFTVTGGKNEVTGTMTIQSITVKPVTAAANVNDISMGSATVSSASVTPGNSVTWTATANADHEFLYWQDGSNQVTANPYTKTITTDTTLTAYFRSTNSTVYFANQTGGSYTVTGTGVNTSATTSTQAVTKNENLSVTLTAAASSGYRFLGWYQGDTLLSTANPWNLTLKDYANQTITAHWDATNVTTTFVPPASGGSYTIGGTAITASTPITDDY